ncbi:hypothetical protein N656DRAFT_780140 [Canariomyces notabilis]|uniref:Uncharacterized protein n=1 Tax=Canariomyces notabilis TaxID=2074819 RepID=A0AAN6TDB5_9PEZI|nr:hypothetical protein N656DRAFT_780140 [Canariomyces arenarius]
MLRCLLDSLSAAGTCAGEFSVINCFRRLWDDGLKLWYRLCNRVKEPIPSGLQRYSSLLSTRETEQYPHKPVAEVAVISGLRRHSKKLLSIRSRHSFPSSHWFHFLQSECGGRFEV